MSTTLKSIVLAMGFAQTLAHAEQSHGSSSISTPKTSPGSSSGGPPSYSPAMMAAINGGNMEFAGNGLLILIGIAGVFLVYRIAISSVRGLRRLTSMESRKQNYWREPTRWYAAVKRHIIYAPLFRTRHHSEIVLTKGWSVGYLPTRFQSIFIILLIIANIIYCVAGIEWNMVGSLQMVLHLRNRTGSIAVSNLIPMALLAGRNQPLIILLNIPFDSFNMIHRWLGRIIAVEAITHMSCYLASGVMEGGWPTAICGMLTIIITATTLFRRAFYDLWHHIHVVLIILVTVALWYHLNALPQQNFIKAFIMSWVIEHVIRLVRLVYRNIGAGGTHALVEYLPGDALKVTISVARPWKFKPGQHMFVAMPFVGLWTTHPFSLAWSEVSESAPGLHRSIDAEKGFPEGNYPSKTAAHSISSISTSTIYSPSNKVTMTAIIRRRDGFTKRLHDTMRKTPDGRFIARAFVEGPYGGHHSLSSYGSVVLFAGGVGITHQVPYVRSLLEGYANSTVACRRLLLVWVIRCPEHLEWIRPWMTEILAMEGRRQVLRVQLYITRPRNPLDTKSPSTSVQMFHGRPDVDSIVEREGRDQVGAMAVSVCGPGHLADDVRRAVRIRQSERSVDFVEEAFGW